MRVLLSVLAIIFPAAAVAQRPTPEPTAPVVSGQASGALQAWGDWLLEAEPGDISDIAWRSNGRGLREGGIWPGNTRNFVGLSARATREMDPPNVEYATSALAPPGSRTLPLTSSAGIEVGDYLRGSLSVPTEAVVQSVSKNTVTLSRPTTGSIEKGLKLGFISPGSKGSQNAAFVMLKNDSSVKASNAIMSLAWCTKAETYCSGGNDVALYDGSGAIKLVGREIDIDFGVRGGRSNGHSGGLFINSFNGSDRLGRGNGPAIQIGATGGYWSVGFECNGVRAGGACLAMGGSNAPIDSYLNVSQGTFSSGAIVIAPNSGVNGQLVRFQGPSGAAATTLSVDERGTFTIRNLVGRTEIVGPLSAASVSASGTIRSNAGFIADGEAGITAVKTVRDASGRGTCTLVFTRGLYTGGTC